MSYNAILTLRKHYDDNKELIFKLSFSYVLMRRYFDPGTQKHHTAEIPAAIIETLMNFSFRFPRCKRFSRLCHFCHDGGLNAPVNEPWA